MYVDFLTVKIFASTFLVVLENDDCDLMVNISDKDGSNEYEYRQLDKNLGPCPTRYTKREALCLGVSESGQ